RHRKHAVRHRTVFAGDDRDHAVQRARPGYVEADGLAVADGAAKDAADERVRMVEIRGVARPPGDFLDPCVQRPPPPLRTPLVRAHDADSAAARTDSMIFT